MGVFFNGQTTSFTGNGTVNPQKLFLPAKDRITDPAVKADMLKLESFINALVLPGESITTELPFSYAVSGTLSVPSGATGYLPPFYWPVPAGQTVTLEAVRYSVRSGTATMNIQHNGSNISTGIAVSATPATTTVVASVANNDSFQPVLTAVSSSDGLTVSFYFSVTG